MELVGYEDNEAGSSTSFSSWVVHNELMMEEFLSIEEIEDKIDEIRLKERK